MGKTNRSGQAASLTPEQLDAMIAQCAPLFQTVESGLLQLTPDALEEIWVYCCMSPQSCFLRALSYSTPCTRMEY